MSAAYAISEQNYLTRRDATGFSQMADVVRDCLRWRDSDTSNYWGKIRNQILKFTNTSGTSVDAIQPTDEAVQRALQFALLIPEWIPAPEVSVDQDGDFWFEWWFGKGFVISVAAGATKEIHYSGLIFESKRYGSEPLSDEIPYPIMDLFEEALEYSEA